MRKSCSCRILKRGLYERAAHYELIMRRFLTILLIFSGLHVMAQEPDTIFLKKLLESHRDLFEHILNHPTHNEVQILYTQIDRDENNVPHLKSNSYGPNQNLYFYPPSTEK